MSDKVIGKTGFESMMPFTRGYTVYMYGSRDDQPNVPDEKNPYEEGTQAHEDWDRGNEAAMFDVMDSEG